jgi:hypothetical protein
VAPDVDGVLVVLEARTLWQDKRVRAASVAQGRRYAERWYVARILRDVPLREAVATLVATCPENDGAPGDSNLNGAPVLGVPIGRSTVRPKAALI